MQPDFQNLGRLPEQNRVLTPTTIRLLRATGIEEGMAVLNIDCGTGDVAMIAADLVGPKGHVVGIDPCGNAIGRAQSRAAAGRYENLDYRNLDLDDARLPAVFDLVVCRHSLIGKRDPVRFLRTAARFVRDGGVLALHEMDMSRGIRSSPSVPKLRVVNQIIHDVLRRSGVTLDAGGRLVGLLGEANLHDPQLFCESVVGTGDSLPVLGLIVATLRSLVPHLTRAENEAIDLDCLEGQLRQSALMLRSQIEFLPQVCAWTRL